MSYDPLDRREIEASKAEAERKLRAQAEQLAADLQWLMANPAGRRLMCQWLAFCGVDRTTFTGDSKGMFKEGARNVGLMLKAQVTDHAFEGYLTMLRENQPASGAHSGGGRP
jgi:hypothetical protein